MLELRNPNARISEPVDHLCCGAEPCSWLSLRPSALLCFVSHVFKPKPISGIAVYLVAKHCEFGSDENDNESHFLSNMCNESIRKMVMKQR